MQVLGLPGRVVGNGGRASRLLATETYLVDAERRRDAVSRWRRAMAAGSSAEQAAGAVGVPRSTLCRWEKAAEPKSRRPHRMRQRSWTSELRAGDRGLPALDFPSWGRDKLGPLLRKAGFTVSNATAGRILRSRTERADVIPT